MVKQFYLTHKCYHSRSVNLGVIAMKEYSIFPRAPELEPHHQMFKCHIQNTGIGGVLPLSRDAVGVFYSPCTNWAIYLEACVCGIMVIGIRNELDKPSSNLG